MSRREVVLSSMRDSVPIMVGYFFVSTAFGLFCAQRGIQAWMAALISATNMSSTGQLTGVTVITSGGTWLELAVGVFLVNLRYVLMAISLSQKIDPDTSTAHRVLIGMAIADEVYALGTRSERVTALSFLSCWVLPLIGWTSGGLIGGLIGEALPARITDAFGLLMFVMFIAVISPSVARDRRVLLAVLAAAAMSTLLMFCTPLASGWRIILTTLVVSAGAATLAPVSPRPHARQEVLV